MRPLKGVRRPGMRAKVSDAPPLRRDPAPSRIAYRLNRLWLRRPVRRAVCLWIPLGVFVAFAANWITDEARLQYAEDKMAALRHSVETRPEFMVNLMAVDGASPGLEQELREILPVALPVSSFDLDLEALRGSIEGLEGVKRADLRIRAGGILQVDVIERVPEILWRNADGLFLLDGEGYLVDPAGARADHAELPLIVGEGAETRVSEALEIFRTAQPIRTRVLGLVRVSAARWDVVLENRMRIMLPEDGALVALDRVIALHEAQDLLSRDITHIDMRHGTRPTLRLSSNASEELQRMRALMFVTETGSGN